MTSKNAPQINGRVDWLQTARQQSQSLAELRSAHVVPFVWRHSLQKRPRQLASAHRRWVTVALTAAVMGLATVTLATLHLSRTADHKLAPARILPTGSGEPAVSKPVRARAMQRAAVQAALPEESAPTAPHRHPRRSAARKAEPAKPAEPASQRTSEAPAGQVIFEGDDAGSMIIVPPPPGKRVPIWTPEQYKKQRAGSQLWQDLHF